MTRVKRGTISNKRRRNVLKRTKGYQLGRSTKEREAKVATIKAGVNAFRDRRKKKGVFRGTWQIKIGAAVRPLGFSYSRFINALKTEGVALDRKVLAIMAEQEPAAFERLVQGLQK